ncbi:MAG: FAD-dependent oxidoreductase, partial [Leeuwenhoekiella sp.]
YLQKSGHKVTIIDQSNMDSGASYVNAGYLAPSHIIPLSAPGVMRKGIKWMFSQASPLYLKPRLEADFLKWAWAFNKSCNPAHVKKVIPAIRDINVLGRDLYADIKRAENFGFQLEKKGLFMLCSTHAMLEEESEVAEIAVEAGLVAKTLTVQEVEKMMPDARMNIVGATYFECDHHTTPHEFMVEMKALLIKNGVTIFKNEKVVDFALSGNKISKVVTDKQELVADEIIMAAGSWTPTLTKKLGIKMLLQAGKGYRVNTSQNTGITYPAILAESKVATTPMNGFTRFAGTMEIAGINNIINPVRVDAIGRAAKAYFPDVEITTEEKAKAQCGLRPVTPDGMPYIGKSDKCANLTFATGHAMMGWCLGPATGLLVSEIIDEKKPSLDLSLYNPDRRF